MPKRYCQAVSDTGSLIVVIGLMDKAIRAMPVKTRFIKLNEGKAKGENTSLIYASYGKKPWTGVMKEQNTFLNADEYAAYVK